MTQPALLLFAISQVQDFIANARTGRDLLTGSAILSHLARQAFKVCLQAEGGVEAIYPVKPVDETMEEPNFPNKFSVQLADYNSARDTAQAAQAEVEKTWKDIADSVHSFLQGLGLPATWDTNWQPQIESLWEIYWVIVPFEQGNETDPQIYKNSLFAALKQANQGLNQRKNLRNFKPYIGDQREKDTIDGLLEQMGPPANSRDKSKEFWSDFRKKVAAQAGVVARLGTHERLSAINLTKRFAQDCYAPFSKASDKGNAPIYSVAAVATLAWKKEVQEKAKNSQALASAIETYVSMMRPFLKAIKEPGKKDSFEDIDGEFLYEENLRPPDKDKTGNEETPENEIIWTAEARKAAVPALIALKTLLGEAAKPSKVAEGGEQAGLGAPPRYYAVIFMDGDNMGKVMSGELKVDGQEARLPEEISQDLTNFTPVVRDIVAGYQGSLIYSGGDDALILLPKENLFKCIQKLHDEFPLLPEKGKETTISGGAAIAHYKHPLQSVLKAAHAAEHVAKHEFAKNAFAITVLKRSGETITAGENWWQVDKTIKVFELLEELKVAIQADHVSPKLAYRLRQETQMLIVESGADNFMQEKVLPAEFGRIFKRQSESTWFAGEKAKDKKPEGAETEEKAVSPKSLPARLQTLAAQGKSGGFQNFNNLLLVTTFLARGGEER